MSDIMIYATHRDAELIRNWINEEPDVAWIVKVAEENGVCRWKAVNAIDLFEEQDYALWHIKSGALSIPSGSPAVPDAVVANPFMGWSEHSQRHGATSPWCGNLPGLYNFSFAEHGGEAVGSLARSDFVWDMDRYKAIGHPAHPEAKRWWSRLQRFVKQSSVAIQWAELKNRKSPTAYVFPDAKSQIDQGRHRDINKTWRKPSAS